jgi:hypothetical protein
LLHARTGVREERSHISTYASHLQSFAPTSHRAFGGPPYIQQHSQSGLESHLLTDAGITIPAEPPDTIDLGIRTHCKK